MLPLKFKYNTGNLSINNLPTSSVTGVPRKGHPLSQALGERVFSYKVPKQYRHKSHGQIEHPVLSCGHNNFKSEPVPGICGVMPGASGALALDKLSPEYKLQHDKLAQTKTALETFL